MFDSCVITAGFHLRGNAKLLHNAVFNALAGCGPLPFGEISTSPSGFSIQDGGAGMTFIGNSVAGARGPCYCAGGGFSVPSSRFRNNTGHGCDVGIAVKGEVTVHVQDMTLWMHRTVAVWGYSRTDKPIIRNMRIADNVHGFAWSSLGAGKLHPMIRSLPPLAFFHLPSPSCVLQIQPRRHSLLHPLSLCPTSPAPGRSREASGPHADGDRREFPLRRPL